jgi:L-seryl-tRNA(Ser) seleniumtransferase
MLDLDMAMDAFNPPPEFIDKTLLPGLPRNGVGRPCKAGKEEIAGLMVALERFLAESDDCRSARLEAPLREIQDALPELPLELLTGFVPRLRLAIGSPSLARRLDAALRGRSPTIYLEPGEIDQGRLYVSPLCLRTGDARLIISALADNLREMTT